MGTKLNPGQFDCYANALPDEPMFILLARDPDFYRLVRDWADRREEQIRCGARPETDWGVVHEARRCAALGETWRKRNNGKWRAAAPGGLSRAADDVVTRVVEWDDRTSPDEFPEALLITPSELHRELMRFAEDIGAAPLTDTQRPEGS